jgi:molecular chaperone DnaJ
MVRISAASISRFHGSPGRAGRQGRADGVRGGGFRFTDIFSQMFGRGGRQESAEPQKGADLEYALNIDFWQAIRGTQVMLNITRQESCVTCNGSGSAGGASTVCPECNGSGNVNQMAGAMRFSLSCPRCNGRAGCATPAQRATARGAWRTERVEVRIPAGAQTGSRLRVAGKGNAGTMGATPGDLYITVRVDPHPLFQRNGDDIEIKLPVRVDEAGLGTKIEVPTIDGRALLKIPQGPERPEAAPSREGRSQLAAGDARRSDRGDRDPDAGRQQRADPGTAARVVAGGNRPIRGPKCGRRWGLRWRSGPKRRT